MENLKSSNFLQKDTMVYGCGVQAKTEKGYHRGVSLDLSDIRLKTSETEEMPVYRKQNENLK